MPKPSQPLSAALLGTPKGEATSSSPDPQPLSPSATLPSGRVALTLRIAPELHERLRRLAFEQRRPMQSIILEAIASHLDA